MGFKVCSVKSNKKHLNYLIIDKLKIISLKGYSIKLKNHEFKNKPDKNIKIA
mgnify:CR=1 FL=1